MLKLTLLPEEYLVINDNIVVQLSRVAGRHADIAVEAAREIPIVRGTVFERQGGKRPECLAPPSGKKTRNYRDQVFRWNDDRERAVRSMKFVIDRLAESGFVDEAKILNTQLDRIIPTFWEEEAAQ